MCSYERMFLTKCLFWPLKNGCIVIGVFHFLMASFYLSVLVRMYEVDWFTIILSNFWITCMAVALVFIYAVIEEIPHMIRMYMHMFLFYIVGYILLIVLQLTKSYKAMSEHLNIPFTESEVLSIKTTECAILAVDVILNVFFLLVICSYLAEFCDN